MTEEFAGWEWSSQGLGVVLCCWPEGTFPILPYMRETLQMNFHQAKAVPSVEDSALTRIL